MESLLHLAAVWNQKFPLRALHIGGYPTDAFYTDFPQPASEFLCTTSVYCRIQSRWSDQQISPTLINLVGGGSGLVL